MSDVLYKATEHYAGKRSELESFKIKEWDLEVFYRPVLNGYEYNAVVEIMNGKAEPTSSVAALLLLAKSEEGKPLFPQHLKSTLLKKVDGAVLERAGAELIARCASGIPTVEDAGKN